MCSPLCCLSSWAFTSMSEWEGRSRKSLTLSFKKKKKKKVFVPTPHPKLYIVNRLTQSLLLCECIGDVSEVNARDHLLRILDGQTQVTLFPLWSHPRLKSNIYVSCDSPCRQAASTVAAGGDDNRAWVKKCQTERRKCCFFCWLIVVKPCPPLSPTGPTLRSGLQQWPGGSLLSLGLTGSDKR